MTISNAQIGTPVLFTTNTNCNSACDNVCPDFIIKRHDTYPPFRVAAEDCDGPLDLSDPNFILEVSMWTSAKLKATLVTNIDYFRLSDDIGFDQIMVGDIIVMDRIRLPEQMLVLGFDETNKLVQVQRGYHGTPISEWKKGSSMKIFRILNATAPQAVIESDIGSEIQTDGSTKSNVLLGTYLVYNWEPNDTCLPGCYVLEYKLLKMIPLIIDDNLGQFNLTPSITPSFTPSTMTPDDFGCGIGSGVEWVRKFPSNHDGFIIKIINSPTSENLYV
jgi:hypothetical protein